MAARVYLLFSLHISDWELGTTTSYLQRGIKGIDEYMGKKGLAGFKGAFRYNTEWIE